MMRLRSFDYTHMVADLFLGEKLNGPKQSKTLVRDSGVHVPSNLDDDSFEDAEASDTPTLASIAEQPEGGEEIYSEVSEESD